ncbi:hypothetical protein Y1Q_0012561 [Alligator mississippiensis]|uniref:Uncharacterized protein n=1 Tax=Alligator mississippiensis TaxID=8496 RepID=A0A151M829_ALLMI|nr:hypothetical protein Y1Q_0012561 [Alligator mississippiensis]
MFLGGPAYSLLPWLMRRYGRQLDLQKEESVSLSDVYFSNTIENNKRKNDFLAYIKLLIIMHIIIFRIWILEEKATWPS